MSARRSSARRQASPPKQQVRNRGLLVVTLLLVGAFAVALAYIKQNAPAQRAAQTGTVAVAPAGSEAGTAAAPAVAPATQQSVLQSIKPKYDFYNELPKRQLVIGQDEINRRDKRELQPPPKPESAQQKEEKQQQNTVAANKVPAKNKAPAEIAQTQAAPKAVEMPKIELISRQGRSSNKPAVSQAAATPAQQTANTAPGGSWMIQAGAYSTFDDADRVRAKLAMMGIRAQVEAGVSNNKPIHRVRIGPLLSKSVAENLNRRLSENNIPALLLKTN